VLFFVKESPLFLLSKSNNAEAFKIISTMARERKVSFSEEDQKEINGEISHKKNSKLKSNFSSLFSADYFLLTFLNLFICFICYSNMIGISYLVPKTIYELNQTEALTENQQLIIYGLIQLPNGIIGGLMTENKFFKRIRTIYINSFLCSIFYFLTYFFPDGLCYFSGFIMLFNSIAFGVAYIYVSEAFPTRIRDQAQSLISCISFCIGSFIPMFIDNVSQGHVLHHFYYLGISCAICSILSAFLPFDTMNRPLDQD
jgi:MFS family permease